MGRKNGNKQFKKHPHSQRPRRDLVGEWDNRVETHRHGGNVTRMKVNEMLEYERHGRTFVVAYRNVDDFSGCVFEQTFTGRSPGRVRDNFLRVHREPAVVLCVSPDNNHWKDK